MSSNGSNGRRGRGGSNHVSPSSGDRGRGRGRGRGHGRGRGGAPPIDRAAVPRGICNYYWTSGACSREFDCSFKHEARTQFAATSSSATSESLADYTPDFFSLEGLAMNNGSVLDSRHTLRPSEAHNHLQLYLVDHFVFRNANNIEGFSRIFASVTSRNRSWDSNQAQSFLDTIVRGNALLRIGDVLRFSPVAVDVGARSSTLSYQKGYFPILEFLSSDLVLKTTMHRNTNKIYTLIDQNYDEFQRTTRECMASMIDARTWEDCSRGLPTSRQNSLDGVIVFKTLSIVLSQYLARFKHAIRNHPDLRDFVEDLFSWFDSWTKAVKVAPPTFEDSITLSDAKVRDLTLAELEKDISRLRIIADREYGHTESMRRPGLRPTVTEGQMQQAFTSRLEQTYDPPGTLRDGGVPRHNNDFTDIHEIRIAPTHEELLCPLPPYLPVYLPTAPHHLPVNSMQRHLDIQFRLLREEMIASIRQSIGEICRDLDIMWAPRSRSKQHPTLLEKLLSSKGGAYRTSGTNNSVFFRLYTGARFAPVKAERRNFTVGVKLDAPPGLAREQSAKKRAEFWEHSKGLQHGNLVALILISPGVSQVFLGTIASMAADIAESAKADAKTIQLRISFFDAEVELMGLRQHPITVNASRYAILVDSGIMLASLQPFLQTLQSVEPTSVPFSKFISESGRLDSFLVEPPRYTRAPGFRYNLQCLARPGQNLPSLDVNNTTAVALARQQLSRLSNLDPSQADALVDTLTREVSLIQGPPGTGKSFTGKEILRVLFSSKIKPIVLIAFTNHALDHLLTSILDDKITTKFVRLGSRTTDERIAQYSLHKLEQLSGRGDLNRSVNREYGVLKNVEEDMTRIVNQIQLPRLTWEDAEKFLDFHYPEHADLFRAPPFWVAVLFQRVTDDERENGEWKKVSKGKKVSQGPEISGIYEFWKSGRDIEFIRPPPKSKGKRVDDPRVAFFDQLGFSGKIPPIPSSRRPLERLIESPNSIWSMSLSERECLAQSWEEDMRKIAYDSNLDEFKLLKERYKEACQSYEDIQDEVRRRLLSKYDLIACTTTGAAKLVSLLTSIGPKVLMVEEAGQVLEAHILAALVPSVEHLICIGDPKQLRPNLATFSLSMESHSGRKLFKFDRSLMERLSDAGMSMSQINVQRRMRPSISHFIRTILYPKLEDHDTVRAYRPVQGMEKNVFFFSHNNAENAEADSVSKYNKFEVAVIRDLVLYFLKQGPYDGAGDIAVLCAYLGQLQKVRAALRDMKIAVSVDERDEDELERTGLAGDSEIGFAEVEVARHIRIGTVDTFQGQEAKIVIISLVRNSGSFETEQGSIGFLKSPNRINVALSRAKHGLYILGNASNLRQNDTWKTVLDEMENEGQVGHAFTICCPRHPETTQSISKPGELPMLAPEGGCLRPCEFRLSCGHVCPSVCHTDQDNHRRMKCYQPCVRITCPRAHPCPKLCFDDCGDCHFPIYDVELPCGHVTRSIPCHMMENLEKVKCETKVSKRLPGCEHSGQMACSKDPTTFTCKEACGGLTRCCSRTCNAQCHVCQKRTKEEVAAGSQSSQSLVRTHHQAHACERLLKCQHLCGLDCHAEGSCNPKCPKECRQRCGHRKCKKPCWEPCPPCMEPCEWHCPHQSCPVVCGSICSRLPCDYPCEQKLSCGHECPSVCGEPCEQQTCIVCLPSERKVDIVDFIMQRTLAEIDLSSEEVSERVITLACGHIFTVETLDGHCHMSEYYEASPMGEFTATKAPPVNYQSPPVCPTCRGPITALRYGRVTKRANLDLLEQNVASTMSSALENVSVEVEGFLTNVQSAKEEAKKIPFSQPAKAAEDFDLLVKRRTDRPGKEFDPLPHAMIHQGSMSADHGFSKEEGGGWDKVVRGLLKLYKKAVDVAGTRGPHVQAYDAALATLYRLELAAIADDPERACDKPEPLAMEEVNKKIGQPPHKADTRFQVEGFLLSLDLRYILAEIAQSRIEGLDKVSRDENVTWHARLWRSYVSFIYESCIRDAEKALVIAQKSTASRLAARAGVYILRGKLELFRFEILAEHTDLARNGHLDDARRKELSAKAEQEAITTADQVQVQEVTYMRSRPASNTNELREERAWFVQNCRERAKKYVKEYIALATHLLKQTGYQPLSLQEKEDIVKAFASEFTHTGHFYNCENGHTFVIGECGGAMEEARCPECRAPVGGSGHNLHRSNTRSIEFEEIAGRQGAQNSPWRWGGGA